ncbi:MAG: hypothetical protein CVV49_03855 [Spirochaetae bacterium HGW-Spirochaetae-5]|nr:MAG: hypothetical protein CVV49_03855 [Spirochaetae bacterium HGW-Spirochaetae-5]
MNHGVFFRDFSSGLLDEEDFFNCCSWIEKSNLDNILQISANRNFSPLTSSAGRLFDAAGSLLGFNKNVSYEAEAAIYVEMLALESCSDEYISVQIKKENGLAELNSSELIKELYRLKKSGESIYDHARIFHNSLIEGAVKIASDICFTSGIEQVVLSGGVFQNRIMLELTEKKLASKGLKVFINRNIPANDAGISAGQAIYGVYNA